MAKEQQPQDRGVDIVHPRRLDVATYRNYAAVMKTLEELPQNPEFPFLFRDETKDQRNKFVLFICPSKRERHVGLSLSFGPLVIENEGTNTTQTNPRKIKLQELTEKILKDQPSRPDLYARPDEVHGPHIFLQAPYDKGMINRFRFPIVGEATAEDVQAAIENSMDMAKRLHEEKYQGPKEKFERSQQILDFVRKLRQ